MVKIIEDLSDIEPDKTNLRSNFNLNFYTNLYEKTIEPAIFGLFLGLGLSSGFYIGARLYLTNIRLLPQMSIS